MQNKRKEKVLGFLLLAILIITNYSTCSLQGFRFGISLSYGEFYDISSEDIIGRKDRVSWSFSNVETFAKIQVRMYDSENYEKLVNGDSDIQSFSLSSGYDRSGTWTPYYDDVWYIVFMHRDTDYKEQTTFIIEVIFSNQRYTDRLLASVIVIPSVSAIVIVILTIILDYRYKSKKLPSYP